MSRLEHQVYPPDQVDPEVWLAVYDSTPAILPAWPESQRLAVVMVRELADGNTIAYVLPSEAVFQQAIRPGSYGGYKALFFQVPRTVLLKPGICPTLLADSWE